MDTHPRELGILLNQAANALTRLDERVAHLGDLTAPIARALAAAESAHSASLEHIWFDTYAIAHGLTSDDTDPASIHPVARLTAAHDRTHTTHANPLTTLTTLNTHLAVNPAHAGRYRLHHDDHTPPGPEPSAIPAALTNLGEYLNNNLPADPIPTAAHAIAAVNHINPYASGSSLTARTWMTHLLHRAHLTHTIPAPLATGLTTDTLRAIAEAHHHDDHDTLTALTAQALLQGTAAAANLVHKLLDQVAELHDTLRTARIRCNSMTWRACEILIGAPVTHSSHLGAALNSDRFGGYTTINKLTDLDILTPGTTNATHHCPQILNVWAAATKTTPPQEEAV